MAHPVVVLAALPAAAHPFHEEPDRLAVDPTLEVPVVVDFDGDGSIEVVAGGSNGVLAWTGRDPFEPTLVPGAAPPLTVGDFDGDGVPDLLARDELRAAVPGWPVVATYPASRSGSPADLDGDGDLDLVDREWWYENVNDGALLLQGRLADVEAGSACEPVDADHDGAMDLACVLRERLTWYRGDGTGFSFEARTVYDGVAELVLGPPFDLDADGAADLLVTELRTEGIYFAPALLWFAGLPSAPTAYEDPVVLLEPTAGLSPGVPGRSERGAWIATGGGIYPVGPLGLGAPMDAPWVGDDETWLDWDGDGEASELLATDAHLALLYTRIPSGSPTVEVLSVRFALTPLSAGDADGDGRTDLSAQDVFFRRVDALGRAFVPEPVHPLGGGAWGDFDGDGATDSVTNGALLERDPATGTWTRTPLGPEEPTPTLSGDLDGDGDLDLVQRRDALVAMLQEGAGFREVTIAADLATAAGLGDMDGDGDLDVAATVFGGERWFENRDGRGTLWVERTLGNARCGGLVVQLQAVDFDEDGDTDVLLAGGCQLVYEQTSPFVFTSRRLDLGDAFVVADLDLDGDLDLVTAGDNNDGLVYRERRSPGIVDLGREDIVAGSAFGPAVLDLDDDGDLDLAASLPPVGIALFRNDTIAPADDPDSDGVASAEDLCPDRRDPGQEDEDADGAGDACECGPGDPTRYPGAPEICDGIDDDCDLAADEDFDLDGDGETACGDDGVPGTADDDCAEGDASVRPGQPEVPYDGVDSDCDPATPDDDLDADGFGLAEDCDDADPARSPAAVEVPYDGSDTDCDPSTPDDDLDADGFPLAEDCRDNDPDVNPDAAEVAYDGVDDDCDPSTPDDDLDGDGFLAGEECDDADPEVHPGAVEEPYDGVDADCDPSTPDDDLDGDGVPLAEDCDDADPEAHADCDPSTPDDDPGGGCSGCASSRGGGGLGAVWIGGWAALWRRRRRDSGP